MDRIALADAAVDAAVEAYNAALASGADATALDRLNVACVDADIALTAARCAIPADQFKAMVHQIARRTRGPYCHWTVGDGHAYMVKVDDDWTVNHVIQLADDGAPSSTVTDWRILDTIRRDVARERLDRAGFVDGWEDN